MNTRKTNYDWREYLLYIAVTLLFSLFGLLVMILKMLGFIWRTITWPLRRAFRGIITLIFLVLLIAGIVFYWYTRPVDLGKRTETVMISKGDDLGTIAARLTNQGVIRARRALIFPAEWIGLDRKLTPGRYDFTGAVTLLSVIHKLETADFVRIKITIYEGAPIWKVAGAIARALEIDSASVWTVLHDSSLITNLGLPYLEGHLFPSTYIVPWGTPADLVVREMVAAFKSRTDSIFTNADQSGLNRYDLLKLASIIQAETRLESEQPQVSSVYRNRLKIRMRLDADPTVIYGLGGLSRPLLRSELRTATPYNTYMRYGLPPTPINSPGLPAILAALRPDTTPYLYFVADGSGGHRFSRTNDEHNRIRREIKRNQRANKKI